MLAEKIYHSDETLKNRIYNEDCNSYLSRLDDRSVDLFLFDPPYMNVVKDSWDKQWKTIEDYKQWCESWIKICEQKAKYSASFWVFGFPYQLAHLLPIFEKYNFKFRQQIVIWKGMKSAAGRVSDKLKMYPTTTESAFFFAYDSIPIIKNMLQEKKKQSGMTSSQINVALGKASNGGGTWSQIAGPRQKTPVQPTKEDWLKLSQIFGGLPAYEDMVFKFNLPFGFSDVWDDISFYFKRGTKLHTTQKPESLIERIVLSSSDPGDFVVDAFLGSGTTAAVSKKTGRFYGGCEMDQDYFNKSVERLNEIVIDNQLV